MLKIANRIAKKNTAIKLSESSMLLMHMLAQLYLMYERNFRLPGKEFKNSWIYAPPLFVFYNTGLDGAGQDRCFKELIDAGLIEVVVKKTRNVLDVARRCFKFAKEVF